MNTTPKLLFILLSIGWMSCNLINPSESIPAYIHIGEFSFDTSISQEGSSSDKITELWVFNNGKMLGAYDLPAYIPVLDNGSKDFSVWAGIKNNGIAATRIMYPFYKPYDLVVDLIPGDTTDISPVYSYKENLNFFLEGFEDPGFQLGETSGSQVNLSVVDHPDSVFEGDHSAFVRIPSDYTVWEAKWLDEMPLPSGKQIWMEMNYKCNNTFAVGLYAASSAEEVKSLSLIINPTTDDFGVPQWNKIYVELTQTAALYPAADHFKLYFECSREPEVDEANIWLDNIKVVHFQ